MLYVSKDSLSDFDFHDADVKSAQFKNGNLYLEVKHLNIHKNTEQNQLETDMECTVASVTFHNAVILSYTPSEVSISETVSDALIAKVTIDTPEPLNYFDVYLTIS